MFEPAEKRVRPEELDQWFREVDACDNRYDPMGAGVVANRHFYRMVNEIRCLWKELASLRSDDGTTD